mgnify:FL=1
MLTYNWYNDNHNVTAMLGHEYVTKWTRNFMAGANNFPNDEIGLGDLSLVLRLLRLPVKTMMISCSHSLHV